jgi:caa(3)-type oxidase subunit IV
MSNVEYKDKETYMYENAQEKLYHGHSRGTKEIWTVFKWLSFITVIDIVLYFLLQNPEIHMLKNIIFIALGIVKAILIVGYFMHLKHERMNLILTIVVPTMFIVFFVIWMLYEGNFWSTFNE